MEPWKITLAIAALAIIIPIIVVIVRLAGSWNSASKSLNTAPLYIRCRCGFDLIPEPEAKSVFTVCPHCGLRLYTSGVQRYSREELDRADRLKKADEEDPETWFLLAEELAKQNRMEEATQCVEKGMSLEKQSHGKRRK
jgi:hypothetical protein